MWPTNPDPLASLDSCELTVRFAGQAYRIPAMDANGWLRILLAEQVHLEHIFPGLAGTEAVAAVNWALVEGRGTEEELVKVIQEVIEVASGRKWWITMRLCRTMREFWDRAGAEMAASGVRPWGCPFSWWLDAAYATCFRLIQASDPKALTAFTQALTALPAGMAKQSVDDVAEGNAFLAAMRQAGGRV